MSEEQKTDILIIGAGLTGLTLAFYLKRKGLTIRVLEKDSTAGGVIHTIRENGFTYETGPNTGVIGNPSVAELFDDLGSNCKLETANPAAKKRLIWKNGAWHPLPSGLLSAIGTPLFTLNDKVRILAEPFRRIGNNPFESVADMVKRRMGKSFLNYAVDPFISGIYAGDPNYLVTKYALPKLYNLEQNYGSFVRGAFKKMREPKDERMRRVTREVFSARNGLGNLIAALEKSIAKELTLNANGISVTPEEGGYTTSFDVDGDKRRIHSKRVITTTHAKTLTALLPFVSRDELSPIVNLKYAKIVQVIAGFNRWSGIDLNAFGGLVPSLEKRNILGVLFTSSFLGNRAPKGGALLSIFLGGTSKEWLVDMSDEEISGIVSNHIKEMMGLKEFSPDIYHTFRYMNAIPQYGKDSKERLEKIDELQSKFSGLILAGNIRDGIGMADRIQQAKSIADNLSLTFVSNDF